MSTAARGRQELLRGTLLLDGRTVHYRVVRSSRARNLRLAIDHRGLLEIIVPYGRRIPPVEYLISGKERWILRHLDRLPAAGPADRLPYLGSQRALQVLRTAESAGSVALEASNIRVTIGPHHDVRDVLERWYRETARGILCSRVEKWSRCMGPHPKRITVRDQRTRWASCSSKGTLSFSWRLVMAPLAVLDYVVIHELMHLEEMHHGSEFWQGVERHCPDYAEHRSWLRINGPVLATALEAVDTKA